MITKESAENYIKGLRFENSNEHEKTLVIGNLNAFYDFILKESIEWERTGNILERDPVITEVVTGCAINGIEYEGVATISLEEIIEVNDIEVTTTDSIIINACSVLEKQRDLKGRKITEHMSKDSDVWKMILNAMDEYAKLEISSSGVK